MVHYQGIRLVKIGRKSHQKSSGVTLLELLITAVVVAILVALGVVNYTGSRERAIGKEADANLKLIAAAEKIYRMEVGGYYTSAGVTPEERIQNINNNLKLSLSSGSSRNWDYKVTGDVSIFTAYGNRNSAEAPACYSITQSLEDPVVSEGTCP